MPMTNNISDAIFSGAFALPGLAAAVVPTNGSTIDPTEECVVPLNPAGATTGNIVTPGVYDRQLCILLNRTANTVTMAAVGTSNCAAGVGAIVPANGKLILVWDATSAHWI